MSADGNWTITTTSPMGTQEGTLSLAIDGGTLNSTM